MCLKTVYGYSFGVSPKFLIVMMGVILFTVGAGLSARASVSYISIPSAKPDFLQGSDRDAIDLSLPTLRPQHLELDKNYPKYLLKPVDVKLYKDIFARQQKGDFQTAQKLIENLEDKRLMGYVDYQRYMHPTAYRSSYTELRDWMHQYRDHAGAERVYKLAQKRRPDNYRHPAKPKISKGTGGSLDLTLGSVRTPYKSVHKRTSAQKQKIRTIAKSVRRFVIKDAPTKAWAYLNTDSHKNVLDNVEFDLLRADIAQSYYLNGKPEQALDHARAVVSRSGDNAPLAGWVAGLASWRNGDFSNAAIYFETVAHSRRASAWMISAGAYWSARAYKRLNDRRDRKKMLRIAAKYPYTFYGLMANRALKVKSIGFDWQTPQFDQKHFKILSQNKIGKRAIGLLQIEQNALAEQELRQINVRNNSKLKEALLAIAGEWNMPALALQIASGVTHDDGRLIDAALYPVIPWQPQEGFEVDRSLIHAFIRQESRFDPNVKSHSGAVGLMQMMPTTASYVAGKNKRAFRSRAGERALSKPEYNIALGQKYIRTLLRDSRINDDLLRLAMAYNAGPGRLGRWDREIDHGNDPLMLIESIPSAETRAFVERVMANYWIYQMRLGQDTPSLDDIIRDRPALYVAQDIPERLRLASDARASIN